MVATIFRFIVALPIRRPPSPPRTISDSPGSSVTRADSTTYRGIGYGSFHLNLHSLLLLASCLVSADFVVLSGKSSRAGYGSRPTEIVDKKVCNRRRQVSLPLRRIRQTRKETWHNAGNSQDRRSCGSGDRRHPRPGHRRERQRSRRHPEEGPGDGSCRRRVAGQQGLRRQALVVGQGRRYARCH